MEPDILNPGEVIQIQVKLSPKIHLSADNLAVVSTPEGVETYNYFRYTPLYLHNNPTPPTDNTDGQAGLPLSYVIPTAGVLYDYDADIHSGAGRWIKRSNASADEANLEKYQNWMIRFSQVISFPFINRHFI